MTPACAAVATVADVMRAGVIGCRPETLLELADRVSVAPDDAVGDAADLLVRHGVTHLVVASEWSGSPVGVISTLDVARAAAGGRA